MHAYMQASVMPFTSCPKHCPSPSDYQHITSLQYRLHTSHFCNGDWPIWLPGKGLRIVHKRTAMSKQQVELPSPIWRVSTVHGAYSMVSFRSYTQCSQNISCHTWKVMSRVCFFKPSTEDSTHTGLLIVLHFVPTLGSHAMVLQNRTCWRYIVCLRQSACSLSISSCTFSTGVTGV